MDSFIFSRVGRKIASLLLAGLIVASTVPAMPVFADNENEALPNANATVATQQTVTDKPTEPTAPTAPTEPPTASIVPTAQPVPRPTTPIVTPVPGPTGSAVNPNKPTEAPTEPPTEQKVGTIETPEGNVNVDLIYSTDSAYVNGENTYVRNGAKLHLNLNGNSQPYAAYLSGENNSRVAFENNELTVDKNLKEESKYELYVKVSENADFIPVKGITIIADYKGPELSNIKYNGKEYDQADWSGESATIPVTFDVSDTTSGIAYVSVIPQTVVEDKVTESGSEAILELNNGKYSYDVPTGSYNRLLFLAKDNVGNSTKNNDGGDGIPINLKRDVTAPIVTIPTEQQPSWSSVKFKVIDEQSGVSTVTAWAALEKATEKGATEVEYASESATSILTPEKDAADTYLYDVPQGNYDRVIIKAQDNKGNSSTSQIVIGKDEKAPDINSITYEAAETPLDRILKFITFGIYSNNNIIVTVTAKDEQSGVDSISLYNGGESETTIPTKAPMETGEEGVASQKFELSSTDGDVKAFDLYVAAKDVAENETRKVPANKISGNVIGKASDDPTEAETAEATIPTGYSEVVVDKKAPKVGTIAIEPTGFEKGTTVWYPKTITIKSSVNDEDSGIDAYTIKHSYDNTEATEIKTVSGGDKPIKSTEICTEISSLGSGVHKFQITAVDILGNENSNGSETSLSIDADAPTVNDIEISPAEGTKNFKQSEKDWYSGNVVLKSTITDSGSGIKNVKVEHNYNNTGAIDITNQVNTCDKNGKIEINLNTSLLNLTDGKHDGKHTITVTAVDNVGNEQSKTKTFYIDTKAPTIDNIGISPAEGIKNFKQSEKDRYSGNVNVETTITDYIGNNKNLGVASGLDDKSVTATITNISTENKYEITKDCITVAENNGVWTAKLNTSNLTLKTGDKLNLADGKNDGKYTVTITAKDKVANTAESKEAEFYIDTKAPEITKPKITPEKDNVNRSGNWYSGNVNVETTITDYIGNNNNLGVASGLDDKSVTATITNTSTENKYEITKDCITVAENNNGVWTAKLNTSNLTLKTGDKLNLADGKNDGKYTVKITAKDKVANAAESKEAEFYIDTKAPEITKPKITPEKDNVNRSGNWYSGNVNVETTITDYIGNNKNLGVASGLDDKSVTATITNISTENKYEITKDCITVAENNGVWTAKLNTSNLTLKTGDKLNLADGKNDGKYTVTITAKDKVANTAESKEAEFYIDTKAPEITKPKITPEKDNVNRSGNWYSGNVNVETTITDYIGNNKNLGVASGLDDKSVTATITNISTENKYEITKDCITVAENNGVWTAKLNTSNLTLKTGDKLNLADGKNDGKYTVTITAKDKVANTAESKEAEFYIDTKAPEITKPKITPEKDNVNRSGNWYSGNVNVETTITDYIGNNKNLGVASGLDDKSVTATITNISTENKYEITKDCITVAENNGVWTAKLNTSNLTLKTGDKLNLADGKNDGKYTVTITAKDKVANTGKSTKSEFYIDTTIPCNYSFRFTGANTNTSKKTPTQPSQVEEKSYGYYFNSATSVTVTMEDCLTNDGALSNPRNEKSQRDFGSGIKEITIWTVGVDGNTKVYGTFSPNSKKEVTITIPAKFKGKVYAYAVDNVGNSIKSKELKISGYSPYGLIAETQDQHNQSGENHAALSMASTKYRDKDGKSLYDHTNNLVGVAVRDTYAGIYEAEITLTYGGTTERFTSTVSNDGEISSKYDGRQNGYLSSFVWDRANKNSGDNLITQMEATIKNLPNLNDVRVQIKLTDRAGNTTTNAETFSVDTTQPEISVSWNQQGKEYYNADRVATVTIKERNFDTNRVNLVVTGGDCSNSGWAYSGGSGDDTAYTAQITFSEDADYTFDISCTDMANNENVVASGSQTSDRFTIDQTKPAISVTYDNNAVSNGNYYNKKRTATITVVEHNFNASASAFRLNITAKGADNKTEAKAPVISGWTNRGDVHTATISFKDDGSYSFTFNYTDLANNSASFSQQLFYIDKAAPKMSISGVEDEHAYNGSVEPEFKVSDPNCDKYYVVFTRIDIEGKNTKVTLPTSKDKKTATSADISYLISQVEDNDGIYKVEYYAKDKAGNETEKKSLVFSVNRFGSTFMYAKDQKELQQATIIDDESYVKNVTKDLIIQEVNVDALEVKTVSVHKDDELMSISEGTDYSVIVSGGKSNNKWVTNSYKFNKDLFADNGRYHIVILTQDDAKNKASNENVAKDRSRELPVKFVVDHSAPEVLITNLNFENAVNTGEEDAKEYVYGDGEGEKQLYSESSKKVIVTVKDPNLFQSIPASDDDSAMEKAIAKAKEQNRYQVYLGTSDNIDQDKQYLDYEITKIENDEVELTMTISATPDKAAQNLIVTANDVVGNKTIAKVTNFTLSATWLMMFFNNVPLVIVVFSVLGLIIVGVVLLVVKKKSKRKA